RESVLYALRSLSGKDVGNTTEAWLEAVPGAEQAAEAARLSRQLRQGPQLQTEILLNKIRDGKGEANTMALVLAIPGLKGTRQERAREFLAKRLARLSPRDLCEKLRDEDTEVRRAAFHACDAREKTEIIPELLALLESAEPLTARTAEATLQNL